MPDLGWDRALLTESSVQYSVADVMTDYGIKSINDYIGVQKAVLKKLTEDGFFADGNNVVVNQESGMTVAITKDGIRETLGKGSRFERLPSKLKKLKIATIQQIPELIKSATMLEDKVADNHGNRRNLTYAYLINSANVDGKEYVVTIVVRQSPDRNKFWMHEIRLDTKKEESDLSIRSDHSDRLQTSSKARIPYGNVSQSAENVKRENENLTTIRNLNEDDLAAMYGSARIPVQELLANTEGAGDVSLIVKNEDTRNNNAHLESDRFYAGDGYGLTAKQTQLWKEMKEEGVDGYVLYGLMMRMEDAKESVEVPEYKEDATAEETLKRQQAIEENRKAARAELAAQAGMTDGQKMRLYSEMVNSYNDEEISDLLDAGMKWKDISALLDKYGEMKAGKSTKEWAAEFANWLDGQRYSEKQREIIEEALLPEAADFYNAMSAAGVRADTALKVEKKARELAGENDLTQKYKAQAVIQSNLSDKEAYAALGAIYSGSTAEKFKAAQEEGIPAKAYAEFWTRAKELHADKDEEGKSITGSRKEKVIELIDSLNLTAEQKDWLVQQEYKSVNLWEMPWR